MKGNNEIILNQATMIEAVQMWIDHCFKEPNVTVTCVSSEGHGLADQYRIYISEKKSEA